MKLSGFFLSVFLIGCGGGNDDKPSTTPSPGGTTGGTGGVAPAPAVENIGGVFTGSGMAQGRNQDITAAYGNGVVYYFAGDAGANVMTARIYGKGAITNRSGQTTTTDPANAFNSAALENGRSAFARFTGTYSPNAASASSVTANAEITGGGAFASLNRDTRYKQTPSTQLPAGTYRARISTTGETATMVVDGTGGFSLTTANNCRITGVSSAAPLSGTAAAGVRMDISGPCIPGNQSGVSLSGVGLVGTNNARLLIGGMDSSNATGLAISAELSSGPTTPPNTFANKVNGVFTAERVVIIVDDNDQMFAMGAQSNNPSLFTFFASGRAVFNGSPAESTGFFLSTFSGNASANSGNDAFAATIAGRFNAPRSSPTSVGGVRVVLNRASGALGFQLGDADLPSAVGHVYNYNQPASLAAAAGRYSTREFAGGPLHNFTIASNGSLTGTLGTCRMTGQLTPRSKNLFDVAVTFGSATEGCANTIVAAQPVVGQTYRGVSYISNIGEESHVFALSNASTGRGYGVRMAKCGGVGAFC